jgi:uracil-DNA glycosylase
MVVGECPGAEEERVGAPFMGASGMELTRMLKEAGIQRNETFITNVIRIRPPRNDLGAFIAFKKKDVTPAHVRVRDKMVLKCVQEGFDLLLKEIEMVQPNVIIALGNAALWALTGKWGITVWRGSVMPCDLNPIYKVIAAYHPAAVLRQWSWRPTLVHDLRRAERESHTRELKAPQFSFDLRPTIHTTLERLELLQAKVDSLPLFLPSSRPLPGEPIPGRLIERLRLSVDIETRQHHITCIGIAWSRSEAICIPFTCLENEEGYWSFDEEAEIVWRLSRLLTHPKVEVIGQNFIYDAQHILRWWHFIPNLRFDTMLAQHVLFVGTPKALDYLASLYCDHYRQWKGDARELWKDIEEKVDA